MIKIPTFQNLSADFTQEIDLNNQIVNLRIKYNIRNEYFTLQFTDSEGTILYGIKILPKYQLLEAHKAFLNFSGDILVIKDDSALGNEITFDNFGVGYNLYYLTEDEVTEWRVDNGLE